MFKITTIFLSIILLVGSCKQPESSIKTLFVGTYTNSGGEGIMTYSFNTETGELQQQSVAAKMNNPSFLTFSQDGKYLYTISEKKNSKITVFKTITDKSILLPASSESTKGNGACYISSDKNDEYIFVANYGSGDFSFVKLDNAKNIVSVKTLKPGVGSNIDTTRQKAPHAHSLAPDPMGKYIYGADLGADRVFAFKKENGVFVLHTDIPLAPGSGPRHFDFSPDGSTMAVVGELSNTITLFSKDSSGCFNVKGKISTTLPDSFSGDSYSADIHFSPDGKFLYSSNRGHNSIAVFSFNNGELTPVQWETTEIEWPRNFTIDPTGKFLLVANQHSNSITIFKRDIKRGTLSFSHSVSGIFKPVCLKFR